jgi:hypothetical protein
MNPEEGKRPKENSRGNGQEFSQGSLQTGFEIPHLERGHPFTEQQAIAFERLATLDRYLARLEKQKTKTEDDPNYNTGGNFSSVMSNVSQYDSKVILTSPRLKL